LKSLHVRMAAALLVQSRPERDQERKKELAKIFGLVAMAADNLSSDNKKRLDKSVNDLAVLLRPILGRVCKL
jgi:hypothetical protein